ncbi:MAG TPA: PAS domain S-box protein, partial [Rhodothermales bacterium]|nr:PAS domain S-box protein [Rhodothermales bacterium]
MKTNTMEVLLIASASDAGDEEALRCLLEARPEAPAEAVRYQLSRVPTIVEAVTYMEAEAVDVMLLDLAGHDAAEIVARMEQDLLPLGVPILLLAEEKDEAAAHYAITRGAQDYLVKNALNRPWLHSALRMAVDRHEVRAQLHTYADLLAVSEARFRTIIEQNADGILIVDQSGEICFTNQAAQKLLKRSKQALEGADWGASLVAGSAAELDITRPDGSQIVVEMRTADIVWEGEPASLATLRDVTERNAVQEALEETATALQHSNKELRMFANAASHDLRQPLRTTSMYLELLSRRYSDAINEEATEWIASAENGIQRMWHLIDALLQYTRPDVENLTL